MGADHMGMFQEFSCGIPQRALRVADKIIAFLVQPLAQGRDIKDRANRCVKKEFSRTHLFNFFLMEEWTLEKIKYRK